MTDLFTNLKAQAKEAADAVSEMAGGVLVEAEKTLHTIAEHENTKAAVAWSKEAGQRVVEETEKLGKNIGESDLGMAAAKGAAVGAVAAIPIPVIGPVLGAVIGAGAGAYLHHQHTSDKTGQDAEPAATTTEPPASDPITTLEHLNGLRQAGAITEEEFQQKKIELLKRI